jgi:hypothetical protein
MNLIAYLKQNSDLRGVYHVDCGECGADAHVIGANRFKEHHADARICPYCGTEADGENTLLIDEHEQAKKYDPNYSE